MSFKAPLLSVDQPMVFVVKVSDGQLTTTTTATVLVHAVLPPALETPGKKTGCGCTEAGGLTPLIGLLVLAAAVRRRPRGSSGSN